MASGRKDWDILAMIAAAITVIMIGVYIGLIRQEDGEVAVWFVAALAVAALLALYGAVRVAPGRVVVLFVSGALMAMLGLVGILSIGLPIIVAGVVALVAGLRATGTRAGTSTLG
jgi:hypothetical protein